MSMLGNIWEAAISAGVTYDLLCVDVPKGSAQAFFEERAGADDVISVTQWLDGTDSGLRSLHIAHDPTMPHEETVKAFSEVVVNAARAAFSTIVDKPTDIYDRGTQDTKISLPEGEYVKAPDVQVSYRLMPRNHKPPIIIEIAYCNSKERKHFQIMSESLAALRGSPAKIAFGFKISTEMMANGRFRTPYLSVHGMTEFGNRNVLFPAMNLGFGGLQRGAGKAGCQVKIKGAVFFASTASCGRS